jgi:hypothetical protein
MGKMEAEVRETIGLNLITVSVKFNFGSKIKYPNFNITAF